MDLCDVQKLMYVNSHFRYILTVIDIFSKFAWAIPLKNKTPQEVKRGFLEILASGRKPRKLHADEGNEFKSVFTAYLKDNNIEFFQSKTAKAWIVERFNRTIKEKMWRMFTFNKNKSLKHLIT